MHRMDACGAHRRRHNCGESGGLCTCAAATAAAPATTRCVAAVEVVRGAVVTAVAVLLVIRVAFATVTAMIMSTIIRSIASNIAIVTVTVNA